MNILLKIESPGLRLETLIQKDALPALLEFVQHHRVENPTPEMMERHRALRPGPRGSHRRGPRFNPEGEVEVELDATAQKVRDSITCATLKDLYFNQSAPDTFPEKFLVVAAWHEAQAAQSNSEIRIGGRVLVRSLVELGETPPANPPRDVQNTIHQGWLARSHQKRLTVTNAGWHHLSEMMSNDNGESPVPA